MMECRNCKICGSDKPKGEFVKLLTSCDECRVINAEKNKKKKKDHPKDPVELLLKKFNKLSDDEKVKFRGSV
jgi:ribosome-binding protein aMBF1 (putative translation factor)